MADDDTRPAWLDADDDAPPSRRRVRILLVAAALPWLVVGALVLRSGPPATPAPPTVPPDHTGHQPPATADHAAPPPHESVEPLPPQAGADGWAPDPGQPAPPEDAHGLWSSGSPGTSEVWRSPAVDADLAGVALVVARAWLTGIDPVLSLTGLTPGETGAYAEHLVVESVEQHGAATAVVSLGAVVLEPDGDGLRAAVRRLAVPLVMGSDGPRPAGAPWWLPERQLDAVALPTAPVDDLEEQLTAAEAVSAAGYQDVELVALARTDAGPWVADVRATTPGGARLDGSVWLRRDAAGFTLLGEVPGTPPSTVDVPATTPPGLEVPVAPGAEATP